MPRGAAMMAVIGPSAGARKTLPSGAASISGVSPSFDSHMRPPVPGDSCCARKASGASGPARALRITGAAWRKRSRPAYVATQTLPSLSSHSEPISTLLKPSRGRNDSVSPLMPSCCGSSAPALRVRCRPNWLSNHRVPWRSTSMLPLVPLVSR